MQALKFLVVGMGVLIFAGLIVVVVTIVSRGGIERPGFGTARVALPPGNAVVETAVSGDRIVLRLRGADGGQRLLLIDAATGKAQGTIELGITPVAPETAR
jgi:hypothetical protein